MHTGHIDPPVFPPDGKVPGTMFRGFPPVDLLADRSRLYEDPPPGWGRYPGSTPGIGQQSSSFCSQQRFPEPLNFLHHLSCGLDHGGKVTFVGPLI